MISDVYFQNLAQKLRDDTEAFILDLLERVKGKAEQLIQDPNANINLTREEQQIIRQWEDYNQEMREWVDQNLPKAYLQGLQEAEKGLPSSATLTAGAFVSIPLLGPSSFQGEISEVARQVLSEIPEHHTMYGVFQQAAYDDFANTRLPVVRSTTDKIRNLVVEASDEAYRSADTLTRRELTQDIMRRLSDEGITGIRYADGRTMKLDSYAEMVARSQTGNASRQATMNRLQEYNRDLVLVSSHYPVSPLCEPHQGKVYSMSGESENYPPFESTNPGSQLFHSQCQHSMSGYTAGQKIPEAREKVDKRENERRYEATQRQRYNERQIRKWKQREVTAVTEDARMKARSKVSEWQKAQRQHIDSNDFLRRKYSREQI